MEQSKADHVALLVNQQRITNAIRRQMADDLDTIIQRRCGGREVYDVACHNAVRSDLFRVIARYYGSYPGDPRALWLTAITDCTAAAYERAILRTRQMLTQHLSRLAPNVLDALQRKGQSDATATPGAETGN